MRKVDDIVVRADTSIHDVLKIIDESSKQLALVVDRDNKLLGTVSDGDIRRGLLNKINLDDTVESIYFRAPTVANINDDKDKIVKLCVDKKIHQIPIVDNDNNIIGLEVLEDLIATGVKNNKVILLVGGLGTRLKPLTNNTPKPMLKVGGKPILETIIEKFSSYGFVNITLCVNYKSDVIQSYFGDGSKFGVNIDYIIEPKRMGTAGPLSLLQKIPKEPFFVMNGDLLTNVNFEHLLDFHVKNNASATMCVREYDFQVPFGVIDIENGHISKIKEKPVHKFFVNAGIYMLSPEVVTYLPDDTFFDMPTLFESLILDDKKSISFPIHEYWLDIGRMEEYKKANSDYNKVF